MHPILGRSDHQSLSQPFRHRTDGHQHLSDILVGLMFTPTPILSFIHLDLSPSRGFSLLRPSPPSVCDKDVDRQKVKDFSVMLFRAFLLWVGA
jgi:hypothetical protein